MEEILPLVSDSLDGSVPVYQPYVCLSWLRELGFIAQHGRKGYSAKKLSEISQNVRREWEHLNQRPNE